MKKNIKQSLLLISISIFIAVINILIVIVGAFKIPKGSAYLAVGHYFLDYFEYVQQIVQGMRGQWLVDNPYTINDPTRTFIGWGQYLIYGKIANIFHWSPYFAYWFIVFILSIVLCLLLFQLVKQLLPKESFFFQLMAWLLSLFAAPFIKIFIENNQLKIVPFNFWYAPMNIFYRFGGVPHHMLTTVLVAFSLLFIAKLLTNLDEFSWKQLFCKTLIISLTLIFLLTFAPFQVINIISALAVVSWFYLNQHLVKDAQKKIAKLIFFLGLSLIIIVPTAVFIRTFHQSGDLFKRTIAWETAQQSYPSLWIVLATTGPILIFIPFAIKDFFKSSSPLRLLFFFFTVFSYLFYYSPLAVYLGSHNGRFITPANYILFGVLTFLGMKTVSYWLTKNKILLIGLIVIFLSYFLLITINIYRSFGGIDRLSYLPKELISGIKILDKQPDKKVVLTSPPLSLGVIVPVLVDRKVYLGRPMWTPDYENKIVLVDQFYRGQMTVEQAQQLVIKNNIGYVILSPLESYQAINIEKYPFLKKIFENKEVKIYYVN